MNSYSSADSLSGSVRAYRALLAAYPKKFRDAYGTQMVQVFRDSLLDAYQRGGASGVIDLWLHTIADLFVTALLERVAERSQYMFSPRIIFWGGLASALGGLLWCAVLLAYETGEITLPLALLLTLTGLATLHARQGPQAGAISRMGLVLGIFGTALVLAFVVWGVIPGHLFNPGVRLQFAEYALGMSVLGTGYMLIGLRMLQTRSLGRSITILTIVLGVLHVGSGMSMWGLYTLISERIDVWNPITVPAEAFMLVSFLIGILWLVLGAILAGQSRLQISAPPSASAQT